MSNNLPTIVLVHGAWHGAWCWEQVSDRLEADGFTVVAPNLPDHDQPASSERIWTTMSSYVQHIHRVLDDIDGEVVLVGHSMGGLITQRVVEKRNVALAILVASAPIRGVTGAVLRLLRREPAQVVQATAKLNLWPMVSTEQRVREHFFAPDPDPDAMTRAMQNLQSESYVAFLSMMARWPRPSKVSSPVSVIAAEGDTIFTLAEQRGLAAAYSAPFSVLPCGHDLMLDHCWPQLAAEISSQASGALGSVRSD